MANLDSLVVEIKADLTDIRKGMKNAVKVTQQSTKKITNSNKLLAGGFNKVRVAAIAAAAGIIYMGKQTLNEVDRIQKLGKKLDTTTEFLSRMKFVAEQSGVAFEQLATGFTMMQRNIGDAAEGVGEAKQAFEALGISAKKMLDMSLEDQFMMISTELANTKNATTRTQIAMDIFGRSGSSLNQILKDGIVSMKELAKTTPNVITQEDADRIASYNDNMNLLKRNIQGKMIPVLAKLADKINELFFAEDQAKLSQLEKLLDKTEKRFDSFLLKGRIKNLKTEIALIKERIALKKGSTVADPLKNSILPDEITIDKGVKAIKSGVKEAEDAAKKSSNVIKDAMIKGTDQWSSRLTDAIIDGGNMFESLAEIAKRTAIQTAIVNPFINALQSGINGLMTPNAPVPISGKLNMGSGGSTININNNNTFSTDMAASVRAEITTYAPELQAATIQGVQSAINNGKIRT